MKEPILRTSQHFDKSIQQNGTSTQSICKNLLAPTLKSLQKIKEECTAIFFFFWVVTCINRKITSSNFSNSYFKIVKNRKIYQYRKYKNNRWDYKFAKNIWSNSWDQAKSRYILLECKKQIENEDLARAVKKWKKFTEKIVNIVIFKLI